MAYAGIVRCELRFALWGWTASYRLHYGFASPVTPFNVVRASEWAATLDIGSVFFPQGVGTIRNVQSVFTAVVATALPGSIGLQHVLLIPDAVGHGGDNEEPVPSSGQSIQVEWITGERGRGVNGRTYFPYMGRTTFSNPSLDAIDEDSAIFIEDACNSHAFNTPLELNAELVVARRQRNLVSASVLDSDKVVAVAVRNSSFTHQRRRVQLRKPHVVIP
jgi:hypothetical protein